MEITKTAFTITLILSMLMVSAIQPLSVRAQEIYGEANLYTTNWFTPNGSPDSNNHWGQEVQNVSQAFSDISSLLAFQDFYVYEYDTLVDIRSVYGNNIHDYSGNTNWYTVTNHIGDYEGEFVTDLYVGHMNHNIPDMTFWEDFSTGGFGNWDSTCGSVSAQTGALIASTTQSGMAQIGRYLDDDENPIIEVRANIKFDTLSVPQSSDSRLELLEINAGDNGGWEYSVAASVNNPNGVSVWTVEIYEGGTAYRFYGLESLAPETGVWYQITLMRDISNGQAKLYVSSWDNSAQDYIEKRLVATGNHIMTRTNEWICAGIVYQSESGTNQVTIDNIGVKPNTNTYGFKGTTSYPWDNPPADGANPTMDYNIYSATQYGSNEHFVLLWVCDGAYVEGSDYYLTARGMAYCWSNGAINNDGYNDGYRHPDGSGYAFIGFEGTSPWLYEGMGTTGQYGQPNIFKYFLVFFYGFALAGFDSYTVNEALDMASQYTGFSDFENAPFAYPNGGFWSYWPYSVGAGTGYYQSLMRIYGDGNIYLPQTRVVYI